MSLMRRGANPKWALFFSGRGSNVERLLMSLDEIPVAMGVASKKSALALCRMKRRGISTLTLEKNVNWQALDQELRRRGITHLFLLGFMKLLPADFVELWKGRIWNLHPSLLPAYPGQSALEKSYHDNAAMGVTIHEVTAEMDAGPPVFQRKVSEKGQSQKLDLPEASFQVAVTEQRLVFEMARRASVWR